MEVSPLYVTEGIYRYTYLTSFCFTGKQGHIDNSPVANDGRPCCDYTWQINRICSGLLAITTAYFSMYYYTFLHASTHFISGSQSTSNILQDARGMVAGAYYIEKSTTTAINKTFYVAIRATPFSIPSWCLRQYLQELLCLFCRRRSFQASGQIPMVG